MSAMSIYHFENGLRQVKPYFHRYQTHPKSRWVNRTLIDVFSIELGQSIDIIKDEIRKELIFVQSRDPKTKEVTEIKGTSLLENRKIKSTDLIINFMHMHEPPVPYLDSSFTHNFQQIDFEILYEDTDVLVVNKQCGIPTHPTGNYRYNTVIEIVKNILELNHVSPCHRLDKGTSGVLILGKTKEGISHYSNIINKFKSYTQKEYVVRVIGDFPYEEIVVEEPVFSLNTSGGYVMPVQASKLPWYAKTVFKKIKYLEGEKHSILRCLPETGKMHQIRIHLRNLGYPIVNDSQYNPIYKDSSKYCLNKYRNDLELELYSRMWNNKDYRTLKTNIDSTKSLEIDLLKMIDIQYFEPHLRKLRLLHKEYSNTIRNATQLSCTTCNRHLISTNATEAIWLHALKYEFRGLGDLKPFSFETSLPLWFNS